MNLLFNLSACIQNILLNISYSFKNNAQISRSYDFSNFKTISHNKLQLHLAVYNIFVSLNMLCPLATTTKYECHWLQIAFLLPSLKYCGVLAITNFGIISLLLNKKEKHFCSDKIAYLCFVVMEYSYMFDILFINNLAL